MTDHELKNACIDKVQELRAIVPLDIPEANLPIPILIYFDLQGTVAGTANYHNGKPVIRLNADLLRKYEQVYINNVVRHEYAHILNRHLNGYKHNPSHGIKWHDIMKRLGVDIVERTHNYQTKPARVHRKFQYICLHGNKATFSTSVYGKIHSWYNSANPKFYTVVKCNCRILPDKIVEL